MKLVEYPNKTFMPNLPRHEPFFQDHTSTIVLKNCPRKYFYRMVLGRTPFKEKYQVVFDFGSAYHKFRELLELEGYGAAMKYIMDVELTIPEPGFKFEYLNKLRLMKSCQSSYDYWLNEKKQKNIEVIAVEQPFNVSLDNGLFISGRADQIVKWNGGIWGRDFKTTSKDQVVFSKGLDPNDQSIRYNVGESLLHGQPIRGIIFEAMYNTKTVGPKIFSVLSTRVKYQLDQWIKEQKLVNRILQIYRETDTWPMHEHNCAWCAYAGVCRLTSEEAMVATLKSGFALKPWDHNNVEQLVMDE